MAKSSRDQAEPRPRHARVGDLRYRATPGLAEQLAKRIGHLPDAERVLVDQLYIQGWPAIKVAALTGEPVRVIRRRAHRIAKRVLAEEFRQSAAQHPHWCVQMRRVGEAVFIRGLSARCSVPRARPSVSRGDAARAHDPGDCASRGRSASQAGCGVSRPRDHRSLRTGACLGVDATGAARLHAARAETLAHAAARIDRSLGPGGVALITGPSGAGKSTLLRLLTRSTGAVMARPLTKPQLDAPRRIAQPCARR